MDVLDEVAAILEEVNRPQASEGELRDAVKKALAAIDEEDDFEDDEDDFEDDEEDEEE